MEGVFSLGAAEAARAIRDGEVKSEELVRSCLARIAEFEPTVQAWVHLDEDLALEQARAADKRRYDGKPTGPLQLLGEIFIYFLCEVFEKGTWEGRDFLDWEDFNGFAFLDEDDPAVIAILTILAIPASKRGRSFGDCGSKRRPGSDTW